MRKLTTMKQTKVIFKLWLFLFSELPTSNTHPPYLNITFSVLLDHSLFIFSVLLFIFKQNYK